MEESLLFSLIAFSCLVMHMQPLRAAFAQASRLRGCSEGGSPPRLASEAFFGDWAGNPCNPKHGARSPWQQLLIAVSIAVLPSMIASPFLTSCLRWCDSIWDCCLGVAAFHVRINTLPDTACHLPCLCCQSQMPDAAHGSFSNAASLEFWVQPPLPPTSWGSALRVSFFYTGKQMSPEREKRRNLFYSLMCCWSRLSVILRPL